MSEFVFDDIEGLQRNREIEGQTGTELGLPGGITLIVLAATDANPRWKARNEQVVAELNRLRNARVPPERTRKFLARVYAETLVKDWKGVKSKGVEVPYSVEACAAFLMAADDAYTAVDAVVYETKNFRGSRIETVVGEAGN